MTEEPSTPEHPPIASYTLGQSVTFDPGRGDSRHLGVVTRIESGLLRDGSVWHRIFVSPSRGLPSGGWQHVGTYQFEDRDDARVSPTRARKS